MEKQNANAKTAGAVVITAILLIGIYVFILNNKPAATTSALAGNTPTAVQAASGTAASSQTNTTMGSSSMASMMYREGTYSATGSYAVPEGGRNTITVTLVVSNDIITSVKTTNKYTERESARYVDSFDNGISGVVVGKKLSNARVGRVNGSSLTGSGFNTALSSIISQAKS